MLYDDALSSHHSWDYCCCYCCCLWNYFFLTLLLQWLKYSQSGTVLSISLAGCVIGLHIESIEFYARTIVTGLHLHYAGVTYVAIIYISETVLPVTLEAIIHTPQTALPVQGKCASNKWKSNHHLCLHRNNNNDVSPLGLFIWRIPHLWSL